MGDELKIWCAVRVDLRAVDAENSWVASHPGKLAAQVGHAFAAIIYEAVNSRWAERVDAYMAESQSKIVVRTDSECELVRILTEAESVDLPCTLVTDAGRTVFDSPTKTVCAFGPAYATELTPYLRRLRLL